MKKCTLCDWENSVSKETLDGWLNQNKITQIDLCNAHEAELKAEEE